MTVLAVPESSYAQAGGPASGSRGGSAAAVPSAAYLLTIPWL
jgi:hypothetical protein